MIEIEKKYRITEDDWRAVERSMEEFSAEFLGEDQEENIIYTGDILVKNGSVLRIRKTDTRSTMTFKKRIKNGSDAKHQIEHETEIKDPDAAAEIVANLGLTPYLIYEKRRKTWRFRNVEVMLDELPFGLFMEIEGSVTGIKEAEMLLNADAFEAESLTYPRLTVMHGRLRDGVTEARFET